MTTRSGAKFKKKEMDGEQTGDLNMAQMLKALLEDRKQREEGLAQERQLREEERRLREEELREERHRRDEETARREEDVRRQMELLQSLVQGVQKQGEAALIKTEKERDVRVTKLTETDDIEAYLTTFERMMKAYEVKEDRWVFKLAPQLVGKAQQAYAAMSAADSESYEKLKKAILARYDITEESYRQWFRSRVREKDETNRELLARLQDLATKWMQGCDSMAGVMDRVVLEQLVNTLPADVRVSVKERRPKTAEEAAQLADDYLQARKVPGSQEVDKSSKWCQKCKKPGHLTKDCRGGSRYKALSGPESTGQSQGQKQKGSDKPKRDLKEVECFNCHQKGHYQSNCPQNAMFCTERSFQHTGAPTVTAREYKPQPGVVKTGLVEGRAVDNILVDTGCSRTLVHRDLVPRQKFLEGEAVAIRCAHGDTVLYPLARVEVKVEDGTFHIEAGVSDRLPVSVLLGTDVPGLTNLLDRKSTEHTIAVEDAFVGTRAQTKRQQGEEASRIRKDRLSGAQHHGLEDEEDDKKDEDKEEDKEDKDNEEEEGKEEDEEDKDEEEDQRPNESSMEWIPPFDDEIFQGGRMKQTLSRSAKRKERQKYTPKQPDDSPPKHGLDVSAEELKTLQQTDITLEAIHRAADNQASTAGIGFFRRDGLLYRRWSPPGRGNEDMAIDQLVLPLQCRPTVLQLAHDIPLAGHLGQEKTARRLLQRFYWPTLYKDVAEWCQHCGICQKTSQHKHRRAPMVPLPIIDVPFKRITMDIVGPLPRSKAGNRFVLVICDYATRYPEAVALRTIDAEHVAEELVKLFARVGVPEEILTDQGSNFTSQLLTELYRMLHIQPIRTSPYHPQTDGLVERFNKTLKSMLRKIAIEEGKTWDKMLPYLLFAYREVPHASTGFSPFELLYGHTVRGPLTGDLGSKQEE